MFCMHRKEMSLFVYPQYHCMNSIIYIYIVLSGIVLKRDVEKLFVICPCRTSAMSTGYLGQPDQGLHFVYIQHYLELLNVSLCPCCSIFIRAKSHNYYLSSRTSTKKL